MILLLSVFRNQSHAPSGKRIEKEVEGILFVTM